MKISACYIAKNEEKNLVRSIESLGGQVDEIIVVDTGSTDNTVEAAEQLGAQVFSFVWADDFAAARNYALAKATGDWLILLDADEYFTAATRDNIRACIESYSQCNGFLVEMRNLDQDTGEELDRFHQLRLVKKMSGLQYVYRIHEELLLDGHSIPALGKLAAEDLQLIHTGYSRSISQGKAARNLRILQQELAEGVPERQLARYLSECYASLGNTPMSLKYAWLDVNNGRQPTSYSSQCHRMLLRYYAEQHTAEAQIKRRELIEKTLQAYPEVPDFHGEYGEVLAQWHQYGDAAEALTEALHLQQDYQGMEPCLLDEAALARMRERQHLFAELGRISAELKLSACIIVKDEAQHIGQWIENVRYFADEIIVVDTGSLDNTIAMADSLGVKCLNYQWQDDFAAAKNYALGQAQGDWVVFTDADELFRYPESVRGYLAWHVYQQRKAQAIFVPLQNIDEDNNDALLDVSKVIRIWRHKQGIHYIGWIHEQLTCNNQDDRDIAYEEGDVALTLSHTGYSSHIVQHKLQRNLQLLQAAAEQEPQRYYYFLAETYLGLGYWQQALDFALLASQSPYQPLECEVGKMYRIALMAMEELAYSCEDRLAVAQAGIRLSEEYPVFYGYAGLLYCQQGDFIQAVSALNQAEALAQKAQVNQLPSHPYQQLQVAVRIALADAYGHLGEQEKAVAMLQELLRVNRWQKAALSLYLDLAQGDAAGQVAFFKELYSTSTEDMQQLLAILDELGARVIYMDLAKAYPAVPELQGDEKYYQWLSQGEYEQLDAELMSKLAAQLQLLAVAMLGSYFDLANNMFRKQWQLLPESWQNIIKAYHGRLDTHAVSYDDYHSLLMAVLAYGNDAMRTTYVSLALSWDFSFEDVLQLAEELVQGHWETLAGKLYLQLAETAAVDTTSFWVGYGILCYDMKEYEEALHCMERAKAMGRTDGLVEAYLVWSREAAGI